jgi:hypothetical protein
MSVVRRAAAVIAGYWVYRTLVAMLMGAVDLDPTQVPGHALVASTLTFTAGAAIVSGYTCALIAKGRRLGAARLLATALAAIVVVALVQRLQQGLGPTWWLLVNLAAAPACMPGAMLCEYHRTRLRHPRPHPPASAPAP